MILIQLLRVTAIVLCTASLPALAHNGHGDELPWQACEDVKKNAACQYTNSHSDTYIGSCKLFNDALMCVRNKPIVRNNLSEPVAKQLKNEVSRVKAK